MVLNGLSSDLAPFMKVIGFDLRGPPGHSTGGRYEWGLPVPVSVTSPGTEFATLVDFAVIVTGFSSVIEGSLAFKT
jgi:hypothetical protein